MNNYIAWKINIEDFWKQTTEEDKIKFLARFGILAPSSHNAQPWKFHIDNNGINIYADFSRRLIRSDEDGRMLYASIGCVLENIKIAADYYGLSSFTEYSKELEKTNPERVLRISFAKRSSPTCSDKFIQAILKRSSYRGKYLDKILPKKILENIMNLSDNEDIKATIIRDNKRRHELALIVAEAMKNKMSDSAFRKELAQWLRINFTQKTDGMPGAGHGMNIATSILAPFVLKNIDVSEVEKKKALKRVDNFPAICIISSRSNTALDWVKTGEMLQRFLIKIYAEGLAASIMAAPIEDKTSMEMVKNIISQNVNTNNFFPQMFFGFGFPEKDYPHSPRRSIKDIVI